MTSFKIISKRLFLTSLVCLSTQMLLAQSKADISDPKVQITWLGIDFSQAKFFGSETDYKKSGELINCEFAGKYFTAWNNLFITEAKKYDVAKAIHRTNVPYALNVTDKVNSALTKDFFSEDSLTFKTLTEEAISDLVKKYDFQGKTGIGMIFFVEGMSKPMEKEGVWVTFVDMNSKTLLLTSYQAPKPGGFGFRNFWMKPFYTILKDMESGFDDLRKSTSSKGK